jgi:hypothetical protein
MFTRLQSRPERPSFRPTLEALEGRELPSSIQGQVMGILTQLPNTVRDLQINLSFNNSARVAADIQTISNDAIFLLSNTTLFIPSSRLGIDQVLFSDGVLLIRDAATTPRVNTTLQSQVVRLGFDVAVMAFIDFRLSLITPSSGHLTL